MTDEASGTEHGGWGETHDVAFLTALVAGFGLGLHGAITGDMAFETAYNYNIFVNNGVHPSIIDATYSYSYKFRVAVFFNIR
jgi:hypothetical protein